MDLHPLIPEPKPELTHKITYYSTDTLDDKKMFMVQCRCGFQELSDDPEEIKDLGRRHRDRYILKI